jgi:hypothetical protein
MNWMTNPPPSLHVTELPRCDAILSAAAVARIPMHRPLPQITLPNRATRLSRSLRTQVAQCPIPRNALVGVLSRYFVVLQSLQLRLINGLRSKGS